MGKMPLHLLLNLVEMCLQVLSYVLCLHLQHLFETLLLLLEDVDLLFVVVHVLTQLVDQLVQSREFRL